MNKILGITIAITTAAFFAAPVYADEVEVDCETSPSSEACIMLLDEETPTSDTTTAPYVQYNSNTTTAPNPTDYPEITDNCDPTIQNCLPHANEGESEIEPIDDVEIIEEETEPVMWPVYVSLGSLGAAVIVFVLLNFFTEQK